MWLVVIIVIAVIGAIIGFASNDDDRTEGCLGGLLTGGCLGSGVIMYIAGLALIIIVILALAGWLFG